MKADSTKNLAAVVVIASLAAACSPADPGRQAAAAPPPPDFTGSDRCASCHAAEYELWQGSHHRLAMQVATEESVLGDFSGTTFRHSQVTTRFEKRGDDFFVSTENADGAVEEFRITHTFGAIPLQQYLVDAPGGRKQALQIAWDSRPGEGGGQRWYHLYPDERIAPGDPLHWTGRYFNWNSMCAECHSTNVRVGYDLAADSFDTTFDEVTVGCEACHGPGSRHIGQASEGRFDATSGFDVDLDDLDGAAWIMNPATGIAERTVPNTSRQQPESCGRCHARRRAIAPDYEYGKRLADTHMPVLLEEHLYHADGRIQDEVYVYGSFLQSRMYSAGVTCSDCHEPHSGRLRAGPDPNDSCAACHLPETFATAKHGGGQRAGDCVGCHMPATTYMGIDDRRDHSFRIPGAGESESHYGAVIAAGRRGGANRALLAGIARLEYPPIARATMLTLLEPVQDAQDAATMLEQLGSGDSLMRIAAVRALRRQPPELRMRAGSALLRDPIRGVRLEAAASYAEYRDLLPRDDARAFVHAADEYRQSLRLNAAMPGAALELARFESQLGNETAAAALYEHAVRIGPAFAPAQHAYGLHLVRSGRSESALGYLRRAAELEPQQPRYVYVWGVALNSLGRSADAVDVLARARQRFPDSFDLGWALATVQRDRGERDAALAVLDDLRQRFPGNARVAALARSLEE